MKTCPNCGKKIDVNSKFCTYCGYKFENAGSAKPQHSNNGYFNWLLETIKRPTNTKVNANKRFGFISLGVSLLLILILMVEMIQGGISTAQDIANSDGAGGLFQYLIGSNTAMSYTFMAVIDILIFVALLLAIVSIVPYVVRRIVYGKNETFNAYLNLFASYSNLVLLIEVACVILLLLRAWILVMLGYLFIPFIYSIAFYVSILSVDRPARHDKVYATLVTTIIYSVLIMIAFMLFSGMIYGMVR